MTSLTEELQRLNELDAKTKPDGVMDAQPSMDTILTPPTN